MMDIIKNRKKFAIVSLAIIILGLVMFAVRGLNYGIEFIGGTVLELNTGSYVELEKVKEIVDEYDEDASIVYAGENKEQLIIKSTQDLSNDDTNEIVDAFVEKYGVDRKSAQSEKIEASMGKEIKNKALLSTLIATIAMLAYISWRFKFNYGLSAVIALVHDILIMIAFYAIFQIPVNSSFIAAILTILGYSINDTIVIFDRIRENNKLYAKESDEEIINMSLKQSLRRTINTSVTTFVAIAVVYIMGVESIRILALPLMVGIVSGTYSSLFIASPCLYELNNRKTIKTAK